MATRSTSKRVQNRAASSLLRQGWPTFFGAPTCLDFDQLEADIAFLGVPFDMATNDRPGSRFGPLRLRDASMRFQEIGRAGWFDLEEGAQILRNVRMVDCGDVDIRTIDFSANFDKMTDSVACLLQRKAFPVIVGGDHTVTYAALRAYKDKRVHVIDFDAHLDFTDSYRGQEYSHDNLMRRAFELPWVTGMTQIGVRGALERLEPYRDAIAEGVHLIPALEFMERGAAEVIRSIPEADAYYVSVDIDVLDPGIAPGTGYPEPGGLSYYQLKDALTETAKKTGIVGFDLVEVSPPYDWGMVTCRIASRLILDFLGAMVPNQP